MSVDAGFAAWLKVEALYAIAAAANAGAWGDSALDRTLVSPLATKDGAVVEAARQAVLWGVPVAVDEHDVVGRRVDLLGCCIGIVGPELGYAAGRNAIVIGANERAGYTTLTVVVRLA